MSTNREVTLVATILELRANNEELLAKLWETDLEGYGANASDVSLQKGRGEGFKESAKIVRSLIEEK